IEDLDDSRLLPPGLHSARTHVLLPSRVIDRKDLFSPPGEASQANLLQRSTRFVVRIIAPGGRGTIMHHPHNLRRFHMRRVSWLFTAFAIALCAFYSGCTKSPPPSNSAPIAKTKPAADSEEGFISIFNGKDAT